MKPIITVNEYPIGWEWLDKVPLEDFTWLIEIFSTITDNPIYLLLQCHQEMGIQSQGNRNPSST